jgi:SAM-dependent methyltransferase
VAIELGQHEQLAPAAWVCRFARLIKAGGAVLDLACGPGRHARYLAGLGFQVEAVDCNSAALATLDGVAGVSTRCSDLEASPWPYVAGQFDGIIVTNYLYRPRVADLLLALRPEGVLIYETFALGNEMLGRPSNPEFLLRPHELLLWVQDRLQVVAFEQGLVQSPRPAVIQRICAVRRAVEACRLDPSP